MVAVMPDCDVPGQVARPEDDCMPSELVHNLVPAVERSHHLLSSGRARALAGFSIGGLQTWNTLLSHPGEFAFIGDFSAGYFPRVLADLSTADAHLLGAPAVNRGTLLHRVYLGNADDVVLDQNIATRALFDRYGIRYEFSQFPRAGHAWETWRHNVADFVPRLRF
jgi:enterochelin esterase-like enzyme